MWVYLIYIFMYTHACTRTEIQYIYMCVCIYIYISISIYLYIYIYIYIYICICIYVYLYISTYMLGQKICHHYIILAELSPLLDVRGVIWAVDMLVFTMNFLTVVKDGLYFIKQIQSINKRYRSHWLSHWPVGWQVLGSHLRTGFNTEPHLSYSLTSNC